MVSRDLAREAGMDPNRATGAALLSDHGFEANYLASSLRSSTPNRAPATSAADRLRTLDELRDKGLVSSEEYAERRTAILDSL